jgi:type IV pilus assembly protein PilB
MRRIGQIFVDLGFITDEQLEMVLDFQRQHPGHLIGKIATERLHLITEEQLAQALAEQWNMQVIHLADTVIPPNVIAYVTEPMAQMYKIVPVAFRDNTLTVAMSNPQNL